MNRIPLVIILGSTGTGKTKLSLEIAKHFRGEIISADSMQVYKALDIITAKATNDEQQEAPHHLLDMLKPTETFTVVDFRNLALPIICKLQSESKMPIVVGGTNYYIESLLWKILLEDETTKRKVDPGRNNYLDQSAEQLHALLSKLDPDMAKRLHPNNKRKILRSLEVLDQKGRTHSSILSDQHRVAGSKLDGGLRYKDALIFWLQCQKDVHDKRLNDRVDDMIKQGLLNELIDFHRNYNADRLGSGPPDYTRGIFQSIGFKEFHSYLMLPQEHRNEVEAEKLLSAGIEDLKMVTRRYARKQVRWVQNRLLGSLDREVPPVYGLDTTDVSKWDECVTARAFNVINAYVKNVKCTESELPHKTISTCRPNALDETFRCVDCDRIFIGEFQYQIHIRSGRHHRMVRRKTKMESITT